MKISRHRLKWGTCVLVVLLGLGVVGYGFTEPRSGLGHVLFHVGYLLPPTRPQFLSFYHWTLETGEGGYLPASVDQFLTDRLWDCEGTEEFDAIVDFQIEQGSARWGGAASREPEDLRRQIVESIMQRLDAVPDDRAISAMVFVESLRRGTPLSKGGFSEMYAWNADRTEWELRSDQCELAKRSFKSWWAQERTWSDKLMQNPLEGTGLRIYEGP